jgi:hypothetical protein
MRLCTWRALLPLAMTVAVSCRTDEVTSIPAGVDASETDAREGTEARPVRRPGVAHVGPIDFVQLSRDGAAAVTRDTAGALRLWSALDGSVEPQIIPARGAVFASVERFEDGATVFVVDASSGGKLFAVDEMGTLEERAAFPPFEPLYEGHVLPGGDRAVLLGRDHALRLIDRRGQTLSRFDDRRFRPERLDVSFDGKTLVALIHQPSVAGRRRVELQRLAVEGDHISRVGSPRLVETTGEVLRHNSSISADAKRFAVVDEAEGEGWRIAIFDLEDPDAAPQRRIVELSHGLPPSLGFVSAERLLVSAADGSLSWLVDLDADRTYVRSAPPQDFAQRGKTHAFARGRQAAGMGTWLFVHDVETLDHRFMGYEAVQAQTLAVSPSGRHVAWGYAQGPVLVEAIEELGRDVVLPGDERRWPVRLRFLDDEHVLVADSAGGVTLLDGRTGREIDAHGVFGGVRRLEVAPDLGLLLVDSNLSIQHVYEISSEGFGRKAVLSDRAYRSGLLAAAGSDDPVVWTLDGGNRLRKYRSEVLFGDPSREALKELGRTLPSGEAAPLAVDAEGRHYGVRWNGRSMEIFIKTMPREGESTPADVSVVVRDGPSEIVPSPRGDRFVAAIGTGQSMMVRAYDAQSGESLWSFSTGVHHTDLVWSPDGRWVGIAANIGAVLLDAASGKTVRSRCGVGFRVSAAPPSNPFTALSRPTLCE